MKHIRCSRCTQEFNVEDPDLFERVKRHEQFHKEYKIKNLNHGCVEWKVV